MIQSHAQNVNDLVINIATALTRIMTAVVRQTIARSSATPVWVVAVPAWVGSGSACEVAKLSSLKLFYALIHSKLM